VVGAHYQIGAHQLVGFARQRLAHAVGEKAHAGDARHRHHERKREDAQLPGTPVAREHSQRQRGH
jgi:hypothetical protein